MEALKGLAGAGLRIALAFLIVSALDAPGPRAGEDGPGPAGAPSGKKPAAPPGAGKETELSPRAEGKSRPLTLVPGETHLLIVLQALADASGLKVVLARGSAAEEQIILLPQAIEPNRESISDALAQAGFSVNEHQDLHERKVLLVNRELKPASKRGSILTPGERKESSPAPAGAPTREARVRIFQEGEGGATSYLVILETRSRSEAEDAASVLRAYLERKAKKAVPASTK